MTMQPHLELGDVYNKSCLIILHMKYNLANDHMEQINVSRVLFSKDAGGVGNLLFNYLEKKYSNSH